MKETKINVRSLVDKYQANCDRISEIASLCETEKRERNEKENVEYLQLVRDNQMLQMKLQVASADHLKENPNAIAETEKMIRENVASNRKTEMIFVRDVMLVSDVSTGGIVPLNVQDIVKPLSEGFILDKVGLPFLTGLVGDFVWPVYEMVDAQLANEGVALSDKKIPFSKLTASPERMGVAISVSNQSLNQTAGLLEMIIREIMPRAIRELLNKIICSTEKANATTNLVGPFVGKVASAVDLSNTPTASQLNKDMKAGVLESGIDGDGLCWIMTKSMEAILELTPISSTGIYKPMAENHMMFGVPIYTTNKIRKYATSFQQYDSSTSAWSAYTMQSSDKADHTVSGDTTAHALAKITSPSDDEIAEVTVVTEYIGLGDFRYQPMGMFGALRFIVDPYSQARKDAVDFVLNSDYATKTIRPDAFKLGKVAASN